MANRSFFRNQYSNQVDVVSIYISLTAAADIEAAASADQYAIDLGAGYLLATGGATRSAEGVLRLKLRDSYNKLLAWSVGSDVEDCVVKKDASDVDGSAGSGNVVDFEFFTAGSAADPDGAEILIRLDLRNSTVGE